jgi:hypothetical protein
MTEAMVEKVLDEAATVNEVRFTLPSLPVTVNSLYQIRWSTREVFLRPECYRWKSESKRYVPRFKVGEGSSVQVHATYHYPFLYKNGKPRVFDVANLLKLTIDTVAEKCGLNDFLVRGGSWDAVDSTDEKVVVVLRELLPAPLASLSTPPRRTTT